MSRPVCVLVCGVKHTGFGQWRRAWAQQCVHWNNLYDVNIIWRHWYFIYATSYLTNTGLTVCCAAVAHKCTHRCVHLLIATTPQASSCNRCCSHWHLFQTNFMKRFSVFVIKLCLCQKSLAMLSVTTWYGYKLVWLIISGGWQLGSLRSVSEQSPGRFPQKIREQTSSLFLKYFEI